MPLRNYSLTHSLTGWQEGHPACKKYGEDGGGGHWLIRKEWRPAGWSMCLPLLIFPYTIKSRSSLLALAHPGAPGKMGRKMVVDVNQLFQSPALQSDAVK